MKSISRYLIAAVVLFVVLYFIFNRQGEIVPVASAIKGTAVNAVTGTVEVFAAGDINVKTERRGVIDRILVKVGDHVEAGDLIAQQSSEDINLRLENAQIRLNAALERDELLSPLMFDLDTIADEIESTELSVRLKQTPQSQLDRLKREEEKKTIYLSLEGIGQRENIALLRNQIEQLELEKSLMEVRAPFAGKIATITVFSGDLINAGVSVSRLLSSGRFVQMELSEEDYYGVEVGQPVTLRLASYPDRSFEGEVSALGQVADSSTKTRNVIINVRADDESLVPGLTGEGYLVKSEREDSILIPRRALIGNLVYVADQGEVEVRRVKTGFLGLNQAEIISGIEVGDLIILEGQSLLRAGDSIQTELIQ